MNLEPCCLKSCSLTTTRQRFSCTKSIETTPHSKCIGTVARRDCRNGSEDLRNEVRSPRLADLPVSLGHRIGLEETMAAMTYEKQITALLVIDPYNDFISEGGKIWNRIRDVAEANDCVPHMLQVLNAARNAGLRVFYAMHRRYRPGDYETWKYIAP